MDKPPELRVQVNEHAEVGMPLNFSFVNLSDLKLACVAFCAQDMDEWFFGAALAEVSFRGFPAANRACEELSPACAGLAWFGDRYFASAPAFCAFYAPTNEFSQVFFRELVEANGFWLACALAVGAFLFAEDYGACSFAGGAFGCHRFE